MRQSADAPPQESLPIEEAAAESWLARPLGWILSPWLRHPWIVLVLATLLTVGSVALTVQRLGFHTSRLDLLNPNSDFNRRWIEYLDEFQHEDDAILVAHSDDPIRLRAAIDAVAERLRADAAMFRDYFYRVDLTALRRKGLYYLPPQLLQRMEQSVAASDDLLQGRYDRQHVVAQLDMWRQWAAAQQFARDLPADSMPDLRPRIAADLFALERHLADSRSDFTLLPPTKATLLDADPGLNRLGLRYLESPDRRYGYVMVRLGQAMQEGQFARGKSGIERLRVIQQEMRAGFPDVEFGLTGLPVMELDEMETSQSDMILSALVSLVGVALVFVIGFGTLWHPLLAVLALVLAMAWSFGGATLFVGHLNILSISFSVILIGLGIDFGIHFLAHYSQARATGMLARPAVERTVQRVGPAILSGGLTTALAFGTARFTDFTGIVELGTIAGQGIVLCIVAALVVLPALLSVTDRRQPARPIRCLPVEVCVTPLLRRPGMIVLTMVLATGALAAGSTRLWYDHNLLNLQAQGLESVDWEHRLLNDTENSAWYVVSIADDPDVILHRKEEFQSLATVQRCEEIVSLVPTVSSEVRDRVRAIAARLNSWQGDIPRLVVPPRESLLRALREFSQLSLGLDPPVAWSEALKRIDTQLQRVSNAEYYERITAYQQERLQQEVRQLQALREIASDEPPHWDDVPAVLRERFRGRQGRHALKVYARGNIWDMSALEEFVRHVDQVDAQATGQPIQTYYASRQMRDSYVRAAGFALIAVFLVLLLDFRSLAHTLLAMVPVLVGVLQMIGVMGWLNLPLNPANMIVLPLILGIGIDDGVHLIHDFRSQRTGYRLGRSTAAAVLITSLTTMAGFGSLMLAKHQGLRSLGLVLSLGVATCLFTSLALLPPILAWLRTANRDAVPGRDGVAEPPVMRDEDDGD